MKQTIFAILFSCVSTAAFATDVEIDQCTVQLNSYISGYELGQEMGFTSQDQRVSIAQHLSEIKALRAKFSDCEVVKRVPLLDANNRAVAAANKLVVGRR